MVKNNTKPQDDEVNGLNQEEDTGNEKIDDLQKNLEEAENKYKRALADYQNLEKRVNEQRRDLILNANRDLLLRLLPILDTLMLAKKHVKDQGLEISINQFLDVLKSDGVVRINTIGESFDPLTMEAVTTGVGEEQKVIEEVRPGYLLHDRLLRPAQVIVGNGKEE